MVADQIPWFVAGPLMGLCVVLCRLLFNGRLGVTGGYSEVIGQLMARRLRFDWRGWFVIGVVAGGLVYALVAGGPTFHGYGWLTRHLHGSAQALIAPILLACGIAIGYGAKLAGGCTSGNGLSGVARLSPASLVATATFFATAIIVSLLTEVIL
jgi:uncharacterized membrane protein YedE/YeeE